MILADTNIVSTFARVDALPLLAKLLKERKIYVAPATYHELRKAVKAGCNGREEPGRDICTAKPQTTQAARKALLMLAAILTSNS